MSSNAGGEAKGKRKVVMGAIAGVCLVASGILLYVNLSGGPREGIVPDQPGAASAQPEIVLDPEWAEEHEPEEILERAEGEIFAEDFTVRIDPDKPSAIPGPGGKMPPSAYDPE